MLTLVLLIPPLLYATVNHLDKYLLDKVFKDRGIGALLIFSSLAGLPVALLVALLRPEVLNDISLCFLALIITNGVLIVAYLIPYLLALQKDEASVVLPLLQVSSVISVILAYLFLGETLQTQQVVGAALVILGSFGISIDRTVKDAFKIKTRVLGLMVISCILIAATGVIFKGVVENVGFWKAIFWENIGIFLASLGLYSIKSYRNDFKLTFKKSGSLAIGINTFSESISVVGNLIMNYALTLAPVSIVYFVSQGFQPVFVLIIGTAITIFLPKVAKENISKAVLPFKILYIAVIVAGSYLLI